MKLDPTVIIGSAILGVILVGSIRRNEVWKSEESLWTDVVSKSPQSTRGHLNLGRAFGNEGRFKEAFEQYAQTVYLAQTTRTEFNDLANGERAVINMAQLEIDEANDLKNAELLLTSDPFPKLPEWFQQLGYLRIRQKRYLDALEILNLGLLAFGANGGLFYNKSEVHRLLGQCHDARMLLAQTIMTDPLTVYQYTRCTEGVTHD